MGHVNEARSLPFGHNAKALEDIDGLVVSCGCTEIYLLAEHTTTLAPRGPFEISPHREFGGIC